MESILTSIKKLLGIAEEYRHYDPDIIMHINSVFMILTQLGVGPSNGFSIEDETTTWDEFIPPEDPNFSAVKSYMHAKVRLLFDPPLNSSVVELIKQMVNELEWRINVNAESTQS